MAQTGPRPSSRRSQTQRRTTPLPTKEKIDVHLIGVALPVRAGTAAAHAAAQLQPSRAIVSSC